MGLTIHYELTVPNKWSIQTVREKLEALRQACMDLPVVEVSELQEFKGEECQRARRERSVPLGEDAGSPATRIPLGTGHLLLSVAAPHARVHGRSWPPAASR